MDTYSGVKDSIPAWIKFSVQAPGEIPYNGIYYDPPEEVRFCHLLLENSDFTSTIIDNLRLICSAESHLFFSTGKI